MRRLTLLSFAASLLFELFFIKRNISITIQYITNKLLQKNPYRVAESETSQLFDNKREEDAIRLCISITKTSDKLSSKRDPFISYISQIFLYNLSISQDIYLHLSQDTFDSRLSVVTFLCDYEGTRRAPSDYPYLRIFVSGTFTCNNYNAISR